MPDLLKSVEDGVMKLTFNRPDAMNALSRDMMNAFSESLRQEVTERGVRVVLIEPGSIATPIWGKGASLGEELRTQNSEGFARYAGQLKGSADMATRGAEKGLDPAVVAAVIVKSLLEENPAPRRTVGPDGKVVAVMTRLLPFRVLYRMSRGSS